MNGTLDFFLKETNLISARHCFRHWFRHWFRHSSSFKFHSFYFSLILFFTYLSFPPDFSVYMSPPTIFVVHMQIQIVRCYYFLKVLVHTFSRNLNTKLELVSVFFDPPKNCTWPETRLVIMWDKNKRRDTTNV